MMKVRVNGREMELAEGTTIEALLSVLSVKAQGTAIDLNREVVPRRLLGSTTLRDGDAVEIVRMVGGG